MRRAIRVVVALFVTASVLSACGSTSTTKAEAPKHGGVLREGLVTLASSDPAKAQTVSERQMADQLYDGLTTWSPTALTAAPAIASSWDVSSDQKHWTFHLRADAKAANGESVNATDVKRSLEHVARKSSGSVSTDLLSVIDGFADFTNKPENLSLSGVVAIDPTTVRIDLNQSFGDLALLLGNPTFGIVHYGVGDATYGTGPFMISGTPTATTAVLVKTPGSLANLDSVAVTYYSDVNASYAAFVNKDVDWTPVSPEKSDEASKAYGNQLFRTSLRTLYLTFNVNNPALANAQFRQAIVQSINRSAVVQALGPSTQVLNGVVPDRIPGHQNASCGATCSYDVERAKTLIAQAFPAGGVPTLTVTASAGAPLTDAAGARIISDLAAAGVTANINRLPIDQFNSFTVNPDRMLFQTSWSAAYPSGGAFLQPLFQGGSSSAVSGINDAKVNADIITAQNTATDSTRGLNWGTVESDVLNLLPVIPLATFPVNSVEQSRVRGIAVLPTGNFDVSRAWVTTPQP